MNIEKITNNYYGLCGNCFELVFPYYMIHVPIYDSQSKFILCDNCLSSLKKLIKTAQKSIDPANNPEPKEVIK